MSEGFSLRMSARTIRDAHLLVNLAADLIETDSIKPGEDRLLRIDGYGDSKSSVAFLTLYSRLAE